MIFLDHYISWTIADTGFFDPLLESLETRCKYGIRFMFHMFTKKSYDFLKKTFFWYLKLSFFKPSNSPALNRHPDTPTPRPPDNRPTPRHPDTQTRKCRCGAICTTTDLLFKFCKIGLKNTLFIIGRKLVVWSSGERCCQCHQPKLRRIVFDLWEFLEFLDFNFRVKIERGPLRQTFFSK